MASVCEDDDIKSHPSALPPLLEQGDSNNSPSRDSEDRSPVFNPSIGVISNQSGASKYDFVKVRVWLEDHFYVLSRYLVCRSLIGTKIKERDAIKISLDLKKALVDMDKVDITHSQFEEYLYKTMTIHGYGYDHVLRFRMMNRFYQKRISLVILIAGTVCIGKSSVAAKLAERMNIPNVFQTDIVHELMRPSGSSADGEFWSQEYESQDQLLAVYKKECGLVREGVKADISKALKEGKPIVIEGLHVDPSLYMTDAEGWGSRKDDDKDKKHGIMMPFVMTLNRADHEYFLQANFRYIDGFSFQSSSRAKTLLENFETIQRYLCSAASAGEGVVVENNIHSFDETVDAMHTTLLERIEKDYREHSW